MRVGTKLTVSDVAAIVGRSPSAIRPWERAGWIPIAHRDPLTGWRVYTPAEVRRIRELAERGKADTR